MRDVWRNVKSGGNLDRMNGKRFVPEMRCTDNLYACEKLARVIIPVGLFCLTKHRRIHMIVSLIRSAWPFVCVWLVQANMLYEINMRHTPCIKWEANCFQWPIWYLSQKPYFNYECRTMATRTSYEYAVRCGTRWVSFKRGTRSPEGIDKRCW